MEQPHIDYDAIIDTAINRELGGYPMTAGHHEIQAVKHAVTEISNAILTVKGWINDLPLSQLSEHQQGIMKNNLEFVSGLIQRFPDRLTTLATMRKREVDGLIKHRRIFAERQAAVDSKEKQLVVEAEAFQANRNTATAKLKEGVKMLRAAEKKEKLLACRERRVVGLEEKRVLEKLLNPGTDGATDDNAEADPVIASENESSSEILSADAGVEVIVDRERGVEKSEEEQAVNDLNLGADVAIEDAAEAAAAEKRVIERLNSPSKKSTPAAENGETSPTDLQEQQSNTAHSSSSEHDLLGPDTIAAKEERLWQREAHFASLEFYVSKREAAVIKRERLLARLKGAHMQQVQNWTAENEKMSEGLNTYADRMHEAVRVEQDGLKVRCRDLIALRDEVRERQDRVWDLIGEAKGMMVGSGSGNGGGGDGGEGEGAGEGEDGDKDAAEGGVRTGVSSG